MIISFLPCECCKKLVLIKHLHVKGDKYFCDDCLNKTVTAVAETMKCNTTKKTKCKTNSKTNSKCKNLKKKTERSE